MKTKRRSTEDVGIILEDYRLSGLSIAGYCTRHNLKTATFHWWLSRERGQKRKKRNSAPHQPFIELTPAKHLTATAGEREMTIEVAFAHGTAARITSFFSLSQLSTLLIGLERKR